ncbi:MAG: site-specific integrase [Oscillospiraceae bacterium]|jgi:site-specific recombinase XerD|nr:site-specific integrase [Oscillospiraceae bacterium]
MKNYDFAYHITNFLTVYLPRQRNASQNTILSYRDTFSNLLRFCQEERGITPEKIRFEKIDAKLIQDFMLWLESSQHASASTRNQRLAAIRSFFRYLQIEAPEHLLLATSILAIQKARKSKPVMKYLTHDQTQALFFCPDVNDWDERRDLALLYLLYDSAARVQEICDVTVGDLHLESPATVRLTGKGRKTRIVPLSATVAALLAQYISERGLDAPGKASLPLFANRQNKKLTRGGVSYILNKYVDRANEEKENSLPGDITPHCLRHSKSMHLLESGVNLIYIRDFLGHEDVKTTQVYAKANPELKREAILKAHADDSAPQLPAWQDNPGLMKFLKSLG